MVSACVHSARAHGALPRQRARRLRPARESGAGGRKFRCLLPVVLTKPRLLSRFAAFDQGSAGLLAVPCLWQALAQLIVLRLRDVSCLRCPSLAVLRDPFAVYPVPWRVRYLERLRQNVVHRRRLEVHHPVSSILLL